MQNRQPIKSSGPIKERKDQSNAALRGQEQIKTVFS